MKYYKIIAFVILPCLASGQDIESNRLSITFKEAVEVALKENVTLRQQQNLLESSEASRIREKFRYLPSVSLNSTYQRIDGQQFDQIQGILSFTQSDRINGSLDASLTLFDGFNRSSSIKQANYNFMAQENAIERQRQILIFNVGQQYLQILLNKELLKIASDNLEVQKTTYSQTKGFVEAGVRAAPDLYTQEAQVQQSEVLKIRSENAYRRSRAVLMQTLLLDPGLDLDPIDPEWNLEEIASSTYQLDNLYNIALENRPDLKQTGYLVKSSSKNVTSSSSGYFPTLTAFFSYGSNFSSLVANQNFTDTNDFPTIGYLNGDTNQPVTSIDPTSIKQTSEVPFSQQFFEDNLSTVYGVRLSIPIFDRFQTRANQVASKVTYENAKLDAENLNRTIYLDVQNAYFDFVAAKENFTASAKQFEAAKKAYEVQQERYDLGIGNLVELSQANNTFVLGSASIAQARFTILFQKVILDYNLGILKFEDIE
jgi:outer membrane protein